MEKLDFKKAYKDLYLPKTEAVVIDVPSMKFIMIQGKGDPNNENGEYQEALALLYGLSFTIKMSKKGNKEIEGYIDYVVPPLEGYWKMGNSTNIDFEHKEKFEWTAMIRQPDFVTKEVFDWACEELKKKKGLPVEKAQFKEVTEGLCVQCMHIGCYDDEPKTIKKIEEYIAKEGLQNDIGTRLEDGTTRLHHEIYLSDPRKTKPENLKTVLRVPVRKK